MPQKPPRDGLSDTDRQQLEDLLEDRKFWARLWAMLKRAAVWVLALFVGLKSLGDSISWLLEKIKQ